VWSFLKEVDNPNKAKCTICGKIISTSATTTMWNHLKVHSIGPKDDNVIDNGNKPKYLQVEMDNKLKLNLSQKLYMEHRLLRQSCR